MPQSNIDAYADGGPVIEIVCTPSQIKSNAAGATIQVTPTVKGNTDTVYAAQIAVNFDTDYFEYSGFTASNEVLKSRLDTNQSDLANGVAVVFVEDDVTGITKKDWKMGTVILKVKSGAVLPAGASSAITCTDSLIGGDEEIAHTVTNATVSINFVAPSTACEVTSLKISNNTVAPSGTTYTANVPYTTDKVNISATFSTGATSNISTINGKALTEGENTFTLTVTAEDGTTTKNYTIKVTRANGDTTNTLSSLSFKKGTQDLITKAEADLGSGGTFAVADKIAYADRDKLSVTFAKKGNLSTAVATLKQGNSVVKNNFTGSLGTLNAGAYTLEIKVTPQKAGAAANTYTITFEIVAADTDNKLSSLSMSIIDGSDETPINFTENFSPETLDYSATVPKNTTKVKLTGKYGALAQVTGLGEIEVTLPCTLEVVVTAQSGSPTKYRVFLAPEKDLGGLTLSNLSVVGFNDAGAEYKLNYEELVKDYRYKVKIPAYNQITKIQIKADDVDDYDIEGRGKVPFDLEEVRMKQYVQFLRNNIVEKNIEFEFIRESDEKTLKKLTCNDKEIDIIGSDLLYKVDKDVKSVNIAALSTDPNATVSIYFPVKNTLSSDRQNVELTDGTTVVVIRVKATDDSEGVYTLSIKRDIEAAVVSENSGSAVPYIIALSVTGVVALILIVVLSSVIISMRKTEKDG